jgi:two-component system, response regulator PdtaR
VEPVIVFVVILARVHLKFSMRWNFRFDRYFSVMIDPSPPPMVVLVAEDEPVLRALAVEALADEGFVAIEASSAADALAVCKANPEAVDVLFTDIRMPGSMDGLQLACRVRERWPWISVVVASGNIFVRPDELPDGAKFLSKPYDMQRVIGVMRDLVAASAH